ncbi:non-ribosomal peptide synthetase [Nocardia cyriacigeorgica]|uniref:non-ribosomal peptide synthetase n=2 Tax=Nocardia cyriacigeorgica TaxID=135487 RepID=UPI000CEA50F7|nr:non-ribosomal peptide synthetase [Nocardia cyriacigeorgica]AVH20748.1 non-ribosomal peptide synthetase [Nocardia cyriacigeorgica]PPJ04993.1 non-ribosomal peptide synthetase [Nocardia cyriacigeorgica]TLF56464.1 non-ribosomal peptide synthetase [Nocardia cyriacigeorgica]
METARRSARGSRRRRSGSPLFGQLLTAAVESSATSVAIRFNPTGEPADERTLTYQELDQASSQVARELIDRGVGPGDVVAIGIARSLESVLAVWAVAKTGAAYVPVDPGYPADRINHIVSDSGAVIGLTTSAHRPVLGTGVYWVELDDPVVAERIAKRPSHPISYADRVRPLDERHPAYVIYTSGSTGRPKGVVVTHTGLAGLVAAEREHYGVTEDSRVLHVCSPNFDVSVLELLLAFTSGATLVIAPPSVFGGFELADLLRREQVTHMLITPGALESVDPAGLDDLEVVVVAGDKFGPELVGRWAGEHAFFNGYGPTEATILATSTPQMSPDGPITIGTAIPGVGAFVLDSRLRPVPAGVVGELYLSGPALAQGYLGRPGLTAERFVASPFGADTGNPGARLYRTGDLVRRTETGGPEGGVIEYLGRSDFQVKIRGFRIELGEIDNALTAHPDIDYAATLGKTLPSGATALVSYVLPRAGTSVDTGELVDFIGESLPGYMIPASIMVLDEIPLTPVGKLDRAALPEPVFAARAFRAPSTPVEEIVADVFAALLVSGEDTRVGADDDFFELGGNSLLAAQAAARIGAALDVRVPVQLLFEATTVAALAARVEQHSGSAAGRALTAVQRPERIPLSYAQQRMWFLNRFDPDSAVNNIPVAVRLSGRLDVDALRAAVRDLAERHEVLRTRYPEVDGEGYQLVLPIGDPRAIPALTVEPATEAQVPELVAAAVTAGFDVTAAPPVRLRLLVLSETEHVLICVIHHIAGDGFSMGPLTRDLMAAYVDRTHGGAPEWPPLQVQYADFALWQREVLGAEDDPESVLAQQIDYWRRELAALPEQLDLPADRPRPAVASNRGATLAFEIDADVHAALTHLAHQHNSTLFMVVHAALAALLARLSGTRDIAIGTPVAGRGEAALDDLIGMFVNTLVLRTEVDPGASFDELLAAVRRTDVQAFGHADVPFERLVELLDPVRSASRHPLFQVMLTFQNLAQTELELPGLKVAGVDLAVPLAKFDLQLALVENIDRHGAPQGMSAAFTYATDLFDAATVQDFADRFGRILAAAAADSGAIVGDVDVLAPGERDLVLHEWNTPGVSIPEVTLVDLIQAQARRRPDADAIRYHGTTLGFGELQRRANRVARALIAQGAGPETLVAVAMPRTEQLPVALLGVLTAGAGYLPIDTSYPAQRLEFMLGDARPICILTTAAELDSVPAGDIPVVLVEDTDRFPDAPVTDAERIAPLRPDNLAYVIYTSGSTGVPKGVGVAHRNVVELFANTQLMFEFDESDVWTLFHSYAFDFSVWELWCALANGGAVVVVDYLTSRSPEQFRELLIREQVTVLNQTPSAFYQLAEADRAVHPDDEGKFALRYVIFGGEALDLRQLRRWYERHGGHDSAENSSPWLVNMYGITETTVHVSFLSVDEQLVDNPASVIGRALPGLDAVVLDDRLHPAPVGVAGEIYVAGAQLSRGYLGRPGLAATRFVANPFGAPGSRMYRTGDIGRWVGFGGRANLEYAGRSDQQVQLRGFRIELGEIEAALQRCAGVGQTVALVRSDEHTGDRLIGYVVPAADRAPGTELDPVALRTEVAEFLTGYMVPDAIVVLDALPLTPNGKLDRRALPAPEFSSGAAFRAPGSPVEQAVAEVFAGLLGAAEVGLDDDFFGLGGNSLLATRAVARINEALDADLAVRELFEAPTVAELAARIEPGAGGGAERPPLVRAERGDRAPLSLAQQRMWLLNQFDPASPAYNIPLAIRLSGSLDVPALRHAVADVLERHETLRTRYPAAAGNEVAYQEILPVSAALPGGLETVTTSDPISRITEMMSTGFDVTEQVPVRALLLGNGADEYLLAMVVHHIAADGASMAPLARDLMTAYLARRGGNSPRWSPLEVQYADFAIWQRAVIGTDDDENSIAARQLAYWREQLDGLTGELELPLDRPRPAIPSMRGASTGFALSPEAHQALTRIAREHNSTLFMVVHAALAVLLSRLSGESDVAVGTPIAGRGERALDDLVGMFVNTLTLRTRVDGGDSFAALVDQARETDLAAFANSDIPFERVAEVVAPGRATAHNPLFGTVLSFQNNEQPSLELPGLTVTALDAGAIAAKFDLQVNVDPRHEADGTPGELITVLTYATDLFDESTAQSFGRRFERILTAVASDPRMRIADIDILDAAERERMTAAPAPKPVQAEVAPTAGTALSQTLAATVEDDPDGPAVVSGSDAFTYQELDAKSSRLARVLIARGSGPGAGVAVRLDRGVDAVVVTWAVLKAGAAVVPFDGIGAATAAGLEVKVGITAGGAQAVAGIDWLVLDDASVGAEIAAESPRPVTYAHRTRALRGADLAYAGAVSVSYDDLAAAAARFVAATELTFESRLFQHGGSDSFAAVLEAVAAGSQGASVVLVPGTGALTDELADEWVTHVLTDRAGLDVIDPRPLEDLRAVVIDGGAAGVSAAWSAVATVLTLADLSRD